VPEIFTAIVAIASLMTFCRPAGEVVCHHRSRRLVRSLRVRAPATSYTPGRHG